jgi:hypothetical protein
MNTSEKVSVTYDGIEIEYLEQDDKWRFELRGRERKADTLAKAKEAIDKPAPQEKTFVPTRAYLSNYSGVEAVTITSLAETDSYSGQQVWTLGKGGSRKKQSLKDCYEVSPENDAILETCESLDDEIEALEKKRKEVFARLKKIEVPK